MLHYLAVNRRVVGSSPTEETNPFKINYLAMALVRWLSNYAELRRSEFVEMTIHYARCPANPLFCAAALKTW
jgi:hypothetical protein